MFKIYLFWNTMFHYSISTFNNIKLFRIKINYLVTRFKYIFLPYLIMGSFIVIANQEN